MSYPINTKPPRRIEKRGRKPKYPWAELRIGQSFTVTNVLRQTLDGCIRYQRAKHKRNYQVISVEGGYALKRIRWAR